MALLLAVFLQSEAEWRTRYAGVLDEPPIEDLARIEPLVNEYFEANAARRREIAGALAGEPRALIEAAVRRGQRYGPAPTGGPQTFHIPIDPGDYEADYFAYVPPTYDPARPMAALVSLHGSGGSGAGPCATWEWELAARGGGDLLLICPSAGRYAWGSSLAGHAAVLDALADARRRWNIDPSRIYLDGGSLGAFGAFELASRYPGTFAAISPRCGLPLLTFIGSRLEFRFLDNLSATPVFYVVGTRDPVTPPSHLRRAVDAMRQAQVPLTYEPQEGGHGWYADLNGRILEWMMAQRLAPYPERFEFSTDEEIFARAYWVEILDLGPRTTGALPHLDNEGRVAERRPSYHPLSHLEGRFDRNRNRLSIEPGGAARLRVYLHHAMADFDRPIEIQANHRRLFQGRVEPSVSFLLEHARRTGDRERVFWASLDVATGR